VPVVKNRLNVRGGIMKRVLIVDDNVNDRAVLAYYVSKYFLCDIFTASNGKEALDRLDTVNPDVIITDISMPVMNGIQFINELAKRETQIPVIAITAVSEKALVNQIQKLDILSYIAKPVNSFRIYESLEEIFNYRTAS
jgi:CheY-like chemotaxis protein